MNSGLKRKGGDKSSDILQRKQIALQRWQILAQTLRGHVCSETRQSLVSVRRFHSFGLLTTQKMDDVAKDDEDATWYCYTSPAFSQLNINVRHASETVRPEDLLGFNNTGNVCVWPSEEIMAYYCLKHIDNFRNSSIVELGGGMTCLTGVALASCINADHVMLTDGNEQSVRNLQSIIQGNDFGETSVNARLLRWGPDALDEDLQEAFDWVLCADCLFFDEGREHLLLNILSLLKPGGQALVFAPGRSGTFDAFCELAKAHSVDMDILRGQYDDHVHKLHTQLKASSDTYEEDLHLPLLVKLSKERSQTNSRDTTPESR